MKRKTGWYVIGVLILGLALLAVSCTGATSPAAEEPKAEEPKAEEPKAEESATPAEGPSPIPHTLEGRDDCLVCHETGVGEATAIPADHAGRPNEICSTCHQLVE